MPPAAAVVTPERRGLQAMRAPQTGAVEIALTVARSNVYAVPFEELAAGGVSSEGLAWNDLRLCVRDYADDSVDPFVEYPVAYLPVESGGDDRFASGDTLIFNGLDTWDFFGYTAGEKRYGRTNVYWLVAGGGAGPVMDERGSWFDWTGLTPPVTFRKTVRFEENFWYMQLGANDDLDGPDRGPSGIRTDHYNWTYYAPSVGPTPQPIFSIRYDLPALQSIAELQVHLQGQHESDYGHRPRLWLSRQSTEDISSVWANDWPFPGNPYRINQLDDLTIVVPGASIPTTAVGKGANYAKIYLPQDGDGYDNIDGNGIGIDWLQLTYNGLFELTGDRLDAALEGSSGRQQLHIRKIPGSETNPPSNLWVFDLTDSVAPARLTVTPAQLHYSTSAKRWELDLQVEAGDGSPPLRLLVAVRDGLPVLPANAVRVRATDPLTDLTGRDYIAVYPEAFAAELEPLFSHREIQGHHVLRAPVQSIYDTYSGGRIHPFAIKRLMRALWRDNLEQPPDYLLLAGDGSNDIAGYALERPERYPHMEQADTNWVPTATVLGSWGDVVSCDSWYVDNLNGVWDSPLNFYPDLHIGRVPCSSPEEAETCVQKILAYETQDLDADWRHRVVLVTDDMFSSRSASIADDYRYRSMEQGFLRLTQNSRAAIRADSIFSHFEIDSLYLPLMMDTVMALGRCVPDPANPSRCLCRDRPWPWAADSCYQLGLIDYAPNLAFGQGSVPYQDVGVRPALINMLGRGALVWAYQGHSNRSLLSHEYIFRHSPLSGDEAVFRLTNNNRPFFFMGYGCHLAEFASHWESRGDAMSEVMMTCCPGQPRGAIAVLGSIDYELIGHDTQDQVFQAMFTDPPRDESDPEQPTTWRLGEIISHAKVKIPWDDRVERISYTLLGDPALRLGIAPPVVSLALNGEHWSSENREYVSSRDDDSLSLLIDIHDESRVKLQDLTDYYGVVPTDSIEVMADSSDDRRMTLRYTTQVQRRPYEIVIAAADRDGSIRRIAVQIPFGVAFYQRNGEELLPLSAGSALEDTATVTITLRTGAHLVDAGQTPSDENVILTAAGIPLDLTRAALVADPGQPYQWTLDFGSVVDVPTGPVTLELQVRQHNGTFASLGSVDVVIGESPELGFAEQPFWMPNPFDSDSYLIYNLSADAARARVRIFTASGRCIFTDDTLPTGRTQRHWRWDGRDDDGDEIANGLYFYELSIWDAGGRLADRVLDKVVRAR